MEKIADKLKGKPGWEAVAAKRQELTNSLQVSRRKAMGNIIYESLSEEVTLEKPKAKKPSAASEKKSKGRQIDLDYFESISHALGILPDQTRRVVEMYYREGKTYKEIGEELGVGRDRIAQIKRRAHILLDIFPKSRTRS